jgi:nucleotide-binding universal stress UspA family protein
MRILLGMDGSAAAQAARELVGARTWPAGTRVRLISVGHAVVDWTGLAPTTGASSGTDLRDLQAHAEDQADALRQHGLAVEVEVVVGDPADFLIERARELFADLIVVGNRGRGPVASVVLGSVSAYLVDHAPCPVLVARSPEVTRMLLAADGTSSSRPIPRVLDAWGPAFRGLPVEVVSVTDAGAVDEDELALHERIAEGVADELMELGWHAAAVARSGRAGREIVRAGDEWHADLIVTGSRGLGPVRRLVAGSVSHDVLLHAHASVLVMRGLVPAEIRQPALAVGGATA